MSEQKPKRIQRKRTAGWRKPEGAVIVDRTSKWGNPYRFVKRASGVIVLYRPDDREFASIPPIEEHGLLKARRIVVDCFRDVIAPTWDLSPLRGRDLVCWCPLSDEHGYRVPCHADVLLELSNGGVP
ncbi:DUF4326 domain-containing protein [Amycolatopsis sp. cmx-4-83]|uniref:DUF4326 domain-containing protein n=1 Tax=Amycolatopsis sp. cmx-4-83 TaxID=2790940 RepID=UPI0039799BAF